MRFLILYFDIAPHVLLVAALVAFLSRGLRRQLPFFFAFMLFQLAYFVAGFAAYVYALSDPSRLTHFYQWVIVTGLVVGAIFELGVLYELSDQLLLSRLTFWGSFRTFLRWTAAALLLLASIISAVIARSDPAGVMAVFQALNFSCNLVEIGLLLALLLFTRVLGISWRTLPAGIAVGFGISASAEVSASALISQLGQKPYVTVDFIRMVAYHACVVVWLIYLVLPEKRKTFGGTRLQMSDLEVHLEELARMVRR
jgi:hypothetical protein